MHPPPTIDDPAAPGRSAQLLLALLLLSILPIFLLTYPIETHSVKLNLSPLPKAARPDLQPPVAYLLTIPVLRDHEVEPPRPVHELVVTAQDRTLINGRPVDIMGLSDRLNSISVREGEWIDFRPDPNARYEIFLEVLAITRRVPIERLRLDSSPFRRSIDEPAPSREPGARPSR